MKRLQQINKNTPTSYIVKPPDWFDLKRLKTLLKFYRKGGLLDLGSYESMLPQMAMNDQDSFEIKLVGLNPNNIPLPKKWFEKCDWVSEELPYKSEEFDYVVMGQLLEHLEDPAKYLKEAMRVLKVGGVLVLSVPLNETEAGEVSNDHLWSFSEQDIIEMLKPYGRFEIEIIKSQFIPEYKYHFPCICGFVKKQ